MRLSEVTTQEIDERIRLVGRVEMTNGTGPLELFVEYPQAYASWLTETADPFLPMLLPPAMLRREAVQIDVPVCDDVVHWAIQLQDIYSSWYPGVMQRVTIEAAHRQPMADRGTANVAAFFSMGVDSFYTLLKNLRRWPSPAGPITHLLYVEGLDTPLSDVINVEATRAAMADCAAETGKHLVIGRSNVRDVFPIDYGRYSSGPCLAGIALSLAPGLRQALIAGAMEYARLYPSASHPLVEGAVRAGHFRVVHDGGERSRLHRIVDLVGCDDLALRYLRVCTQNRSDLSNCGACQKCLRTMLTLHLMGTLERSRTFARTFAARRVRELCIRDAWDAHYLEEILEYAQHTQADSAVTNELRRLFRIHRRWTGWQQRLAPTPFRFIIPALERIQQRVRLLRRSIRRQHDTEQGGESSATAVPAVNDR